MSSAGFPQGVSHDDTHSKTAPWFPVIKMVRVVGAGPIRKDGNGAFNCRMERVFLSGQCDPTMMSYFAISRKA
jgi:hypothetical protein